MLKRRHFICIALGTAASHSAKAWGLAIHSLITKAAVAHLPKDMPRFFLAARRQLEFLSAEPDVWRDREEVALGGSALNVGHDSDHIFKFELYNPEQLPPNRFDWLDDLRRLDRNPRKVGTLPYRSMELFQRTRVSFRRWRRTGRGEQTRRFLEARIIEDSGLLSHYLADAAMPMHMSVNRNGWEEDDNPENFTRDRTFHSRFESRFALARFRSAAALDPYMRPCEVADDPLVYIHAHLRRSWEQVKPLYRLEKKQPFTPENNSSEHIEFCARRLADAASTIRDLWYTAYATSAPSAAGYMAR